MNRLQPCDDCGCPVVYHRPHRSPSTGHVEMLCEECTRKSGAERLCRPPLGTL